MLFKVVTAPSTVLAAVPRLTTTASADSLANRSALRNGVRTQKATIMSQAQDASVPASAAADSIFADKSRHHWSLSLYDAPQPAPDTLTNDQEQLNPRQAYMSLHKERLADFKAAHPGAVRAYLFTANVLRSSG